MVKIVNMFIPKRNTFTRPGIKMNPTSITIHETDNPNPGANALAHARLQKNGNRRQASWHFQVDDRNEAFLSIPLNEVAYHAGTRRGNYSSIAIEICVNRDGNYKKSVENAAKIVRYIMKRYPQITRNDIKQHYDWSKKNCPRRLRNSNPINWHQFLNMIGSNKTSQSTQSESKRSTKNIIVGSKVKLKKSATHYATGERIPNRYKGKTYTVQQRKTDRVLLKELYSWVKATDVTNIKQGESSVSKSITTGSKVILKRDANRYTTGEKIPARIKGKTYTVQQIKGKNALLKEIYSWVKISDLRMKGHSKKNRSFKVGQKVKIKRSATKYSRSSVTIPAKYKGKKYTIQQVGKNDLLLKELYSWVRKDDIQ